MHRPMNQDQILEGGSRRGNLPGLQDKARFLRF